MRSCRSGASSRTLAGSAWLMASVAGAFFFVVLAAESFGVLALGIALILLEALCCQKNNINRAAVNNARGEKIFGASVEIMGARFRLRDRQGQHALRFYRTDIVLILQGTLDQQKPLRH